MLVLLPADEKIQKRLRDAAPGFNLTFANSEDKAVPKLASESEVIIGQAPVKYLQPSENLRFVQLCVAGTEPYSSPGALPERVYLTNSTGAFGLAVSEHMLAALLCLYKKLHLYRDNMKDGSWIDRGEVKTLRGATVLILGLGDIGSHFAKMVNGLGAYTIGVKEPRQKSRSILTSSFCSQASTKYFQKRTLSQWLSPQRKRQSESYRKKGFSI